MSQRKRDESMLNGEQRLRDLEGTTKVGVSTTERLLEIIYEILEIECVDLEDTSPDDLFGLYNLLVARLNGILPPRCSSDGGLLDALLNLENKYKVVGLATGVIQDLPEDKLLRQSSSIADMLVSRLIHIILDPTNLQKSDAYQTLRTIILKVDQTIGHLDERCPELNVRQTILSPGSLFAEGARKRLRPMRPHFRTEISPSLASNLEQFRLKVKSEQGRHPAPRDLQEVLLNQEKKVTSKSRAGSNASSIRSNSSEEEMLRDFRNLTSQQREEVEEWVRGNKKPKLRDRQEEDYLGEVPVEEELNRNLERMSVKSSDRDEESYLTDEDDFFPPEEDGESFEEPSAVFASAVGPPSGVNEVDFHRYKEELQSRVYERAKELKRMEENQTPIPQKRTPKGPPRAKEGWPEVRPPLERGKFGGSQVITKSERGSHVRGRGKLRGVGRGRGQLNDQPRTGTVAALARQFKSGG